jgi:hypothetical protein
MGASVHDGAAGPTTSLPGADDTEYFVNLEGKPILVGGDKAPLLELVPDLVLRVGTREDSVPRQAEIVPLDIRQITRDADGGWVVFAERKLDWAIYRFRIESTPATAQIGFSLVIRYSRNVWVAEEALRFRLGSISTAHALDHSYRVQEVTSPFSSSNHTPIHLGFQRGNNDLSLVDRRGIDGVRWTRVQGRNTVDVAIYDSNRRSPERWPVCDGIGPRDPAALKTQKNKDYADISGGWVPGHFEPVFKWRYRDGTDCLLATARPTSSPNHGTTEGAGRTAWIVDKPCRKQIRLHPKVTTKNTELPTPLIDTSEPTNGSNFANLVAPSKRLPSERSYFRWRPNVQTQQGLYFRSSGQFSSFDAFRQAKTPTAIQKLCSESGLTFASVSSRPSESASATPRSRAGAVDYNLWEPSISEAIGHLSDLENVTVDYPSADAVRVRNRNSETVEGLTLVLPSEEIQVEIENGPVLSRRGKFLWGDIGGRQEIFLRLRRRGQSFPLMKPKTTAVEGNETDRP